MKLTKGKIRKAINKKKQTMKRYKKSNINNGNNSKKTNYKSKTFRKKRSTNLLKSTLKNYGMLGGAEGEFYKLKEGAENDGKFENYEPFDSRENATHIEAEVDLNDLPEAENVQPVSSNDSKKEEVIKALEVLTNYILEKNYERTGAVGTVQGMTETFDKELSK